MRIYRHTAIVVGELNNFLDKEPFTQGINMVSNVRNKVIRDLLHKYNVPIMRTVVGDRNETMISNSFHRNERVSVRMMITRKLNESIRNNRSVE